jgi:hypothetical protein
VQGVQELRVCSVGHAAQHFDAQDGQALGLRRVLFLEHEMSKMIEREGRLDVVSQHPFLGLQDPAKKGFRLIQPAQVDQHQS